MSLIQVSNHDAPHVFSLEIFRFKYMDLCDNELHRVWHVTSAQFLSTVERQHQKTSHIHVCFCMLQIISMVRTLVWLVLTGDIMQVS